MSTNDRDCTFQLVAPPELAAWVANDLKLTAAPEPESTDDMLRLGFIDPMSALELAAKIATIANFCLKLAESIIAWTAKGKSRETEVLIQCAHEDRRLHVDSTTTVTDLAEKIESVVTK